MGKRVIAVAVGVLVAVALAAGGVLVAGRSGQGTPATLPALDVSSSGDQAAGASTQAAPGRSSPADGNAESRMPPSGTVRYQVRGNLPDLPRSARAWTLPDQVTKARVAELAGKLGLTGEPAESGLTWTVSDGTRRLFVNQVAGGPWTFSAGRFICGAPTGGIGGILPNRAGCPALGATALEQRPPSSGSGSAEPALPAPVKPGSDAGTEPPGPSMRQQPPPRVVLPDRATAERIARDLFGRVGAPMDGAEPRLLQSFDRWSVSAFPRVGGQPTTGFIWTAGIGSKGEVVSATGWLDTPRQGDVYPLIGVREALDRLRNRQVGGPITDESTSVPCVRSEQRQPPAGGCGPAKPLTLQVTDVRLGLQFASALAQPNGSKRTVGYLVPAYLFQINGSWERQVSVIAVQDRFLTTTPPPTAVPLRPGG
ncbi:MAG TPA: hypothetical protein VFA45_15095 [Actinomycetes bacterium]|jgi:hypothetical protein|nr:hypothetical protein [Actinomycetes bacterium]